MSLFVNREGVRWGGLTRGGLKTWPLAAAALAVVALVGLAFVSLPFAQAQTSSFTDAEREEIGDVVREYLLANPEIVLDVLNELQRRDEQAEAERSRAAIIANSSALYENPDTPFIGNPDADVVLVEFFDYNCGFCKRMLEPVMQLVEDDPNLRIVLKEFPILGPESMVAARAALAMERQGLYTEYHNALMTYRGRLDEAIILDTAVRVGGDLDQLQQDMDDPAIMEQIQRNIQLAQAIGVNGTPAFVIDDQIIPGAIGYPVLRDLVERSREG